MPTSPLRLGLALEEALGHKTHSLNLQSSLAADPTLTARVIALPYEANLGAWARLPLVRSNWSLRASLGAYLGLRREAERLDALFFHTQVTSLLSTALLRQIPGLISLDATPIQYDRFGALYGHTPGNPRLEALKARLNQRAFTAARGLITWSQWAKDSLIADYGVPAEKITVLPPGVALQSWNQTYARRQDRLSDGRFHLLFVGGDFERKGGDLILRAFDELPEPLRRRTHIHVVTGATDLLPREHVTVYNNLTPNSPPLQALFAQADLFVFPTRADCLALVVLEAMAAGVPVITTAVAALPEIVVDGVTGCLVPQDDAAALSRVIASLLADPGQRCALAARARQEVTLRFDADQNYTALLNRLKALTRS